MNAYARLSTKPYDCPTTTIIWLKFQQNADTSALKTTVSDSLKLKSWRNTLVGFPESDPWERVVFIEWKMKIAPSEVSLPSMQAISDLLREPPTIYNVSFNHPIWNSWGTCHEILIWKYKEISDLNRDTQLRNDQRTIDTFFESADPARGHDLSSPLTVCSRGWIESTDGRLVSLFCWSSKESELRFKNPQETNHYTEWKTENDLYAKSFLTPVQNMRQEGWIVEETSANLRLKPWEVFLGEMPSSDGL